MAERRIEIGARVPPEMVKRMGLAEAEHSLNRTDLITKALNEYLAKLGHEPPKRPERSAEEVHALGCIRAFAKRNAAQPEMLTGLEQWLRLKKGTLLKLIG